MRYQYLLHTCVIAPVAWLSLQVAATPQHKLQTHRVLRAATKRTDLYRRSVRIKKIFEAEVAYVEEENGWDGRSTFASQVKVVSQKPVTNLEEIEHHLQDVRCEDGIMRLDFVDVSSARDAFFSCHGEDGGLVITSHDTCNDDGERSVYRVNGISFTDNGHALELTIFKSSWEDAFDHLSITFGDTSEDHLYRRHSDFAKIRKRQSVDIPADTPDSIIAADVDVSSQLLNSTFTPDSFLSGLLQLSPIPTAPIAIGCNNCTTTGLLKLTQGAITINATQIDLIPDIFQGGDDGKEITSVVTGGFFEVAATGMSAHLDLFAQPAASGAFDVVLFKAPIVGFVVPGIGKAGMTLEPRVVANFTVGGALELKYGVNIVVPDDSKVHIKLTDIAKSTVTGFPDSTITMLPIATNDTDSDVVLDITFQPTISVGFEFLNKLKSDVSVSMNLPRLDAKLSSDIATNCGNASASASHDTNTTASEAPGSGTSGFSVVVGADLSITVDVGIDLKFPLLPPPPVELGAKANLFSTNVPLVESCTMMLAGDVTSTTTMTSTMVLTRTAHATPTIAGVASQWNAYSSASQEPSKLLETWIAVSTSSLLQIGTPSVAGSTLSGVTTPAPAPFVSLISNATDIHPSTSCNATISSIVPSTNTSISTPSPAGSAIIPSIPTIYHYTSLSNAGVATGRPSASTQPFSAATHGTEAPTLRWSKTGWQFGAVAIGVLFGALVL